MDNKHILEQIDASISIWKKRVYDKWTPKKCPLCNLHWDIIEQESYTDDYFCRCPIAIHSRSDCEGTSFYETGRGKIQDNNKMLSYLYEVRLWFINEFINGNRDFLSEVRDNKK